MDVPSMARQDFPHDDTTPSAARRFVAETLSLWGADELADSALLLVSELSTNAIVHAGSDIEVTLALGAAADDGIDDTGPAEPAVRFAVTDRAPERAAYVPAQAADEEALPADGGRGLLLVGTLAQSWGVTYTGERKTVWFTLSWESGPVAAAPVGPANGPGYSRRGWLTFLAEADELLAGLTDVDQVCALTTQLLVPRIATWAAVFLTDATGFRLAHAWHADERQVERLYLDLEKRQRPRPRHRRPGEPAGSGGLSGRSGLGGPSGPFGPSGLDAAQEFTIGFGSTVLGTLVLGRAGLPQLPPEVRSLVEDLCHRVALTLHAAHRYARPVAASEALERSLVPREVGDIPGGQCAVWYRPAGEDTQAGGDFYDVFRSNEAQWTFVLGDVCGRGPEAALITGLARNGVRLLAREGTPVTQMLDRLNRAILAEGAGARMISMVLGQLTPLRAGGMSCVLCCAGHVPPLLISPGGRVETPASSQILLGVVEQPRYRAETFSLRPGQTLVCVTDGVTGHRDGGRLFDDGDGLAGLLAHSRDTDAPGAVRTILQALSSFSAEAPHDDVAVLALTALAEAAR